MSSSSSSSPAVYEYEVFLSFRGEDTRATIVSHLYKQLVDEKISTFKDDRKIEMGDHISEKLDKALHNSKFAIVVISENYATSIWCLEELRLIMKLEKEEKIQVIPLFFGVYPSAVRYHRDNFDLNMYKDREKADMIPKWKEVLTSIAGLSGAVISNGVEEAKMVQDIVKRISSRLFHILPIDAAFIKGMGEYMEVLKPLLDMENSMDKVRLIGICGIEGTGKTTIAKYLYGQHKHQFSTHHCFMENVGSLCRIPDGILYLQNKLLSELDGKDKYLNFDNKEEGARLIKERLMNLKVLLVLDNVDEKTQLDYLAKEMSWFGDGSRIIVTTKSKNFLSSYEETFVYDVEYLDDEKALQLFKETAFEGKPPLYQYNDLSKRISRLAHGNPLIIKAFGSSLREKTKVEWEDALKSFEESCQDNNVKGIFKVSYERLNEESKTGFLHVACLFNGESLQRIIALFNRSDVSWIRDLAENSLVHITTDGLIAMPGLAEEMGKQIVRQGRGLENNPANQRILWHHEDIYQVVADKSGTSITEGVSVDVGKIPDGINIRWKAFRKMHNLIFLKIYNNSGFNGEDLIMKRKLCVPLKLRLLDWDAYPLTVLPSMFSPDSLVEINMCNSKLTTLWSGKPELLNLRRMDLTGSEDLKQLPELEKAEYLEELILKGCTSLEGIPKSICSLSRLQKIDVSNCKGLKRIMIKIRESDTTMFQDKRLRIRSLKLAFSDAETPPGTSFTNLSIQGKLNIEFQLLGGSADHLCFVSDKLTISMLEQQPLDPLISPPYSCKSLDIMHFHRRKSGQFKCDSFSGFPWLMELNLINLNIQKVPDNIHEIVVLEKLDLSGNDFKELPTTMSDLLKLKHLTLCNCRELTQLPELYQLEKLILSDCTSLKTLVTPLYQGTYSLLELWLDNCKSVENLSDQLKRFPDLTYLDMSRQDFQTVPTSTNDLTSLVTLCLNYCKNLTTHPSSLKCLIKTHGCNSLPTSSSSTNTCLHPTQNPSKITRFPAGRRGEEVPMCDCFEKSKANKKSMWSGIVVVWEDYIRTWFWCFVIGTLVLCLHNFVRITGIDPFTPTAMIFHIYLCTFLTAIFIITSSKPYL